MKWEKSILKMIFLFPRWDMLISWRVYGIDPTLGKDSHAESKTRVSMGSMFLFVHFEVILSGSSQVVLGERYHPETMG